MGYISELETYLQSKYPRTDAQWQNLWQVSGDNQLSPNWLLATPTHVWGVDAENMKAAVPGNYPDFNLADCGAATSFDAPGKKVCAQVRSTVKKVGGAPDKLSVGPGFETYERMYDAITKATKLVDITTLFTPTGEFLAAIRNAITYISTKPENQRPKIRFLYSTIGHPRTADAGAANRGQGASWWAPIDPWKTSSTIMKQLVRDIAPAAKMEIYVAVVSSTVSGWNHSKIVACDGQRVICGGQNMWADHYLGTDPVFDVSMELTGSAALHAHDYVDELWYWTPWLELERPNRITGKTMPRYLHIRDQNLVSYKFDSASGKNKLTAGDLPDRDFYKTVKATFTPIQGGTSTVLAIGRQAQMRWPELWIPAFTGILHDLWYRFRPADEPADDAILKLFELAKTSILISQQNITGGLVGLASKRRPYLEAMADAVCRGVKVTLIVSETTGTEYGGDVPSDVNTLMLGLLTDSTRGKTVTQAKALLQQNFLCANIAYNAAKTYPSGNPVKNHAKTFIVDSAVFYIGSHNLYPSNLNEFGVIVEDATAAADYIAKYWGPLLEYSKTSGPLEYTNTTVDTLKSEAVAFLLALGKDKRLNDRWQATVANRKAMAPGAGASDADKQAYNDDTAGILTVLIYEAGFDTTASYVVAAQKMPFWTDTTQNPTNADSDRFVKDISTNTALFRAWVKVIAADYGSNDQADSALTTWLKTKGYSCTAAQVNVSLNRLRDQALQFWTGFYNNAGFVLMDGGSYFNTSRPQLKRDVGDDNDPDSAEQWDPSYPAPSKAPSLTIYTNTTTGNGVPLPGAALGGIEIINPTFQNGVLSWTSGSGFPSNATSGSLTFSEITRPTEEDGFVGRECYGTITFPADGTAPLRGTVSYYNRESTDPAPDVPPSVPTDKVKSQAGLIGGIIAGAVVIIAAAAGVAYKLNQSRKADDELRRRKKDLDDADDSELERLDSGDTSVDQQIQYEANTGAIDPGEVNTLRQRRVTAQDDYERDQANDEEETNDNLDDTVTAEDW